MFFYAESLQELEEKINRFFEENKRSAFMQGEFHVIHYQSGYVRYLYSLRYIPSAIERTIEQVEKEIIELKSEKEYLISILKKEK